MFYVYSILLNVFYFIFFILFLPKVIYAGARHGKYRQSLPRSLGFGLKRFKAADFAGGSVWIHGASVGEMVAASALLPEVRARLGHLKLVVSTVTETGQAQARRLFPDADAIIYFPMDFSWNAARFQRRFNPKVFLLLEAEIWPNFLLGLRRRGCPAIQFNAKMSDRSFQGYGKAAWALRPPLRAIRLFCAQTAGDAERLGVISGRPEDVVVAGNVKLDSLPRPLADERRAALLKEWALPADAPAIIFGSTHPTEEELALDSWRTLRAEHPALRLIICPRHPERFGAVARLCRERLGEGFRLGRASEPESFQHGPVDVLLLDKMGVLGEAYGLATLAVMGGSFAPIGGHNLLEPAPHGVPMICGPCMKAQRELVRLAQEGGAFVQVQPEELAPTLGRLLRDANERADLSRRCREIVLAHRGAAKRGFEEAQRRRLLPGTSSQALARG